MQGTGVVGHVDGHTILHQRRVEDHLARLVVQAQRPLGAGRVGALLAGAAHILTTLTAARVRAQEFYKTE